MGIQGRMTCSDAEKYLFRTKYTEANYWENVFWNSYFQDGSNSSCNWRYSSGKRQVISIVH